MENVKFNFSLFNKVRYICQTAAIKDKKTVYSDNWNNYNKQDREQLI